MSDELLNTLKKWGISYEKKEHPPVYTVEEALQITDQLPGLGCKNLFLTNKKGTYYLYVLEEKKRANIKELELFLKEKHLTFASENELLELLSLTKGSVTPLGIINDKENKVIVILAEELKNQPILVHPNRNTATISIAYKDLIKFIKNTNHHYQIIGKEKENE